MELKVKLEGFEELSRRIQGYPERLRKNYMRGGMRALVAHLRKGARRRVPVRSGALRRAIGVSTRVFQDGTVQGKVYIAPITSGRFKGQSAWYGHIVERGAKAHVIRPKNGKALSFGGRAFSSIQHPGVKGRHFMRDTRNQDMNTGQRLFGNYVEARTKEYLEGK